MTWKAFEEIGERESCKRHWCFQFHSQETQHKLLDFPQITTSVCQVLNIYYSLQLFIGLQIDKPLFYFYCRIQMYREIVS